MTSNARWLKAAITTLVIIISYTSSTAQHEPTLWGVNLSGENEDDVGSLFQVDTELNQIDVAFDFMSYPHGRLPGGRLVFIGNKAYGIAARGGKNDQGVLYVYDLDTEEKTTLHHFDSETGSLPGAEPLLVEGKLYGGTTDGGTHDAGVLYEFDPASGAYMVLHEFDDTNDGKSLVAGLATTDDVLYGITYEGGTSGLGTLFKYELFNQRFTLLHALTDTQGTHSSYALLEQEGIFYGVGLTSGESEGVEGRIFIYDTSEETFTSVSMEHRPTGSLVPVDGKLYGTATSAFVPFDVIYEFDPTDNSYEELRGFEEDDAISFPRNSFIEYSGWLYGLGGTSMEGYLYRYKIETNELERVHTLDVTDGVDYAATLVIHNGNLFGTATKGGLYNGGTLLSFDADEETFNKHVDFENIGGGWPNGPLIEVDGIFYGTTAIGGEEDQGVLFAYNHENEDYTLLLNFETMGGGEAKSSVIHDSGKLYGTTVEGGADGNGILYQYDLNTQASSILYDFIASNGSAPVGTLILDNNKLYGGTYSGGTSGFGLIYEFDLTNNTLDVLHHLDNDGNEDEIGLDGSNIENGLLKMGDILYGTTASGGLHDGGTLFTYDLNTGIFSVLHHFTELTGARPGQVIMVDDILYGTVNTGGTASRGGLFEFDPAMNQYEMLHHFGIGVDGLFPAPVLTYAEGQLYGITPHGGTDDKGVLFQYTIDSRAYSVVLNMNATTVSHPTGGLLVQSSNEAPEITIDEPIEVCAGSEIPAYEFQVSDSDGDLPTFTVTSSNTTLVPNASLSVIEATEGNYQLLVDLQSLAVGETVITITAADGYGGEGSAELSISGLSLPTIGINATREEICMNESVTLSATGGTSYTWEGSVEDGVAFEPKATATYTVTGEDALGCTASASLDIIVYDLPVIQAEITTSSGSIDVSITEGLAPYLFDWDNDGVGDMDDAEDLFNQPAGTYTLAVTDTHGCLAMASFDLAGILAITRLTAGPESFEVYPNPVATGFQLLSDDIREVWLHDLQGQVVKQYLSPESYYNIEDLDRGVYLLSLKTDERLVIRKIVKL